jgi:hypothetical protein
MQTKPLPVIEASDLKAARDFLTSLREDERNANIARDPRDAQGSVTLRNGIARARLRSAPKTPA